MNDCDCDNFNGDCSNCVESRSENQLGDDAKQLKFGIDKILSSEYSCPRSTSGEINNARYYEGSMHCCPFNHVISSSYAQFCPSLYITTNSFLPVVRKYTNFIIEGDGNPSDGATSKRKRIWSRAVFSKLQRKGLEKRFQVQKYIMKPDRKQLAATLGLTDAQVKVWFQNRRMKWRNSRENNTKNETDDDRTCK